MTRRSEVGGNQEKEMQEDAEEKEKQQAQE